MGTGAKGSSNLYELDVSSGCGSRVSHGGGGWQQELSDSGKKRRVAFLAMDLWLTVTSKNSL